MCLSYARGIFVSAVLSVNERASAADVEVMLSGSSVSSMLRFKHAHYTAPALCFSDSQGLSVCVSVCLSGGTLAFTFTTLMCGRSELTPVVSVCHMDQCGNYRHLMITRFVGNKSETFHPIIRF